MQFSLFLALTFLAGIIIFIFQNTSVVTVQFLSWTSPDISLAVVVLMAACAGALVTFLLNSVRYFKLAKKIKELTTMNKKMQKELENLKSVKVKNKIEDDLINKIDENE